MTTADLLRHARSVIAEPGRWAKGGIAIDAAGRPVPPSSPGAVRWSALGAVCWNPYVAEHDGCDLTRKLVAAVDELRAAIPPGKRTSAVAFNDAPDTAHDDVLAWFDRAIASAKRKP